MIKYGKLIDYDDNIGTILDIQGQKYIVLEKDIMNDNIKLYDNVEFSAETFSTANNEYKIARFVNKINLESNLKKRNK